MHAAQRIASGAAMALFAAGLAACSPSGGAPDSVVRPTLVLSSPRPQPNPGNLKSPVRDVPIANSEELSRHYDQLEGQLITNGALREDLGSLDSLSADDLATNFIRIAMYDEYTPVDGRLVAQESSSRLRRWQDPVTLTLEHGNSVGQEQRALDIAEVQTLLGELNDASGHSIRLVPDNGNFSVFVVNETERLLMRPRLRALIPGISVPVMESMLDILPSTFCLVVAFSSMENPQTYIRAIAIIRAEHPPVLRRACFHEEIAQGLGLANDSREARPSIFNDDEEFALLTSQDRLLLRILYDPRLRPGMEMAEAAPIVQEIARELLPAEVAAITPPPPVEQETALLQ